MKIDDALLDKLSGLCKLDFEGEDREEIKQDLGRMLEFVEKLNELDVTDVEPLIYMTDEVNHLRQDEPEQLITHEEALKNAPDKDSDYFRVPKVLEK